MHDHDESSSSEPLRVLLVDDSPTNLQVLMETLRATKHKLLAAKNGKDALSIAKKARPSLILLDIMMPELDGYETCRALKADPELAEIPVIFLSALDEMEDKVKAFDVGGVDYISKPFQADEVVARVTTHLALARAKSELETRNRALERELAVAREIHVSALRRQRAFLLGESPAVQGLRALLDAFGERDDPVLICAPSGSGDESLARELHERSSRKYGTFLVEDCSGVSTNASSFTRESGEEGATSKFDLAHGGTLFLENVHRLGDLAQRELLAYLESSDAARARGDAPMPDVWIIASTKSSVGVGRLPESFDPKLVARLSRGIITNPSLVERREDIPVLAEHFLQKHARRVGKSIESIAPESQAILLEHSWPRNVRELEEVIQHAIVLELTDSLHISSALLEDGISMGSYRLVEKIGAGGMGEVWKAKHKLLARPAAVKVVRSGDAEGMVPTEERTARFKREAIATSRLTSTHTVSLYDFGVSEEGDYFYVMELLEGADLDRIVRRDGPQPPERVAHLLIQACLSLAEAHEAGLVHRDIKPANLFAARLGLELDVLKVLDFGIVSALEKRSDPTLTSPDSVAGTPAYLPPEAVVDGTTALRSSGDVYSLGCVGYWLLTGTPVFDGSSGMQIMMAHVQKQPRPPRKIVKSIPREFEKIILDCLSKEPDERPSVLELERSLRALEFSKPWNRDRASEWWKQFGDESGDSARAEIDPTVTQYPLDGD